jgi:Fic family protein
MTFFQTWFNVRYCTSNLRRFTHFLDGNGRVGRLLITLFLMERGRLSQPLLYLSSYIEAHRQDYYDLLQRVRTHGDWNAWIMFFLTGVKETAQQALRQTSILVDLRETTGREWGKVYLASALANAIQNPA